MKNKLAQLHMFVSKIDQRYVYLAFMLAAMFMPSDGGATGR